MSFFETVYEIVKQIPRGKVLSYGRSPARRAFPERRAKSAGRSMSIRIRSTFPGHRVVNREGRVSPAFVFGGENMQVALLKSEGVEFDENGLVKRSFFV